MSFRVVLTRTNCLDAHSLSAGQRLALGWYFFQKTFKLRTFGSSLGRENLNEQKDEERKQRKKYQKLVEKRTIVDNEYPVVAKLAIV